MKIRILIAAIAAILTLPIEVDAQTIRATTFPNNSLIQNQNVSATVARSSSGVIALWYRAIAIAPGGEQMLVASYDRISGVVALTLSVQNTVGEPSLANGNHLVFNVTNGFGGFEDFIAISDTPVPYDGGWWHIAVTWDTAQYFPNRGNHGQYAITAEIKGSAAGQTVLWNPERTLGSPGGALPFSTPYVRDGINNSWTVGGWINPNTHNGASFYHGDLAELFVDVGPGDQVSMMGVRPMSGFVVRNTDGSFGPAELGPFCMGPLRAIPTICLRGGMPDFLRNMRGRSDFVIPAGYLSPVTASTDPFEIYP